MNIWPIFCYSPLDCSHSSMLTLISVHDHRHNTFAFPSPTLMPSLSLQVLHTKLRSLSLQISFQPAGTVLHFHILGLGNLWRSSVLDQSV